MRTIVLYVALLAGVLIGFILIDACGMNLTAPEPTASATKEARTDHSHGALIHLLLTLTAVVALGWFLGVLLRHLGQPPVIGEVIAGIVLGPSVLGQLSPEAASFLLPESVAPFLSVIAQLGVIIYMFLIGLELNLDSLKDSTQATITIAHAGIAIPFVLGAALALLLYPRLSSNDVPFTSFALFLGVAMAITAFPVLARILSDRGMRKTPLGVTALACAALGDATAWCLLAFVVAVTQAKVNGAFYVIGLTVAYITLMFLIVRPVAARLLTSRDLTRGVTALIFVALLLSALATEYIGVHAILGAFLFGAVIPHDSAVAREFTHKLEDLVTVLLLPAFFAFTGLRTHIGLLAGWEEWLLCGLIIAVATAGKFGGTLLAARVTGLGWRESSALGILMNTRGLMELIVLNIGLELKVISPQLFAMMVLMALVTTIATTPLLQMLGVNAPTSEK
ncbi:MAG TPA: cation:proton antiporter [Gemmataceae bacterium]|nr:cation:proton antiporter [Gemmataceae bacterium]